LRIHGIKIGTEGDSQMTAHDVLKSHSSCMPRALGARLNQEAT